MTSKIRGIRQRLERRKGERDQVKKSISSNRRRIQALEEGLDNVVKAQAIIHEVAKMTQEELQYHLSDLVSLAMSSIFSDPYRLAVDFVSRRGKVELDLNFEKDGNLVDPMTSTGGGAVDVAALALRFSAWTLRTPRTRPVILMDEPLKWLKGSDLPLRGSEMIREISRRLGLQIITVSHDPELIEGADRVIETSIHNKVSQIGG